MFLSILINILLAVNIIVSVLIILLVLMQRPKSEGLGAAFGGGMTENFFGAQTTTVLTNFTRWLGGIFFALTLTLSVLYAQKSKASFKSDIQKQVIEEHSRAARKAPAAPAVAPSAATPAPTPSATPQPAASTAPTTAAPAASGTAAR